MEIFSFVEDEEVKACQPFDCVLAIGHGSPRAVGGHAFLRDGDVCLVMLVLCGHRCRHESHLLSPMSVVVVLGYAAGSDRVLRLAPVNQKRRRVKSAASLHLSAPAKLSYWPG
jgi:hypothetical protein